MPLIDLADTVLGCSPTDLTVTRYTEIGFVDGLAQPRDESDFQVRASVQPLDNEDLLKLPEGDRTEGGVAVFSVVRMEPRDQFSYNEVRYEVIIRGDWLDLGGYYKTIAKKVLQVPAV